MKWDVHDNDPDIMGGTVLLDGEPIHGVRRLDTEEGRVVCLHGDHHSEYHTSAECPDTGGGRHAEVCEVELAGTVEVFDVQGTPVHE